MMYILYDTFNEQVYSNHRSITAAVRADKKLQKQVKKNNGTTAYLPTKILHKDMSELNDDEVNTMYYYECNIL